MNRRLFYWEMLFRLAVIFIWPFLALLFYLHFIARPMDMNKYIRLK